MANTVVNYSGERLSSADDLVDTATSSITDPPFSDEDRPQRGVDHSSRASQAENYSQTIEVIINLADGFLIECHQFDRPTAPVV